MHIDPLRTVADLPCINHPGIHNRFDSQVQIGVTHHNGWRLAAKLQTDLDDIFGSGLHHLLSGRHTAG
ncbi:hypothetical protein D3C73_1261370 [compost metagenome]